MIIIGVSGITASGKSTLATSLVATLTQLGHRTELIHQDDFFASMQSAPRLCEEALRMLAATDKWKSKVHDTNSPQSINWEALLARIEAARRSNDAEILVIEGFLLYNKSTLDRVFDIAVFVNVPRDIALYRKWERTYSTGNRAMTLDEFRPYFDIAVYPSFERHGQRRPEGMKSGAVVVEVDGTAECAASVQTILTAMRM